MPHPLFSAGIIRTVIFAAVLGLAACSLREYTEDPYFLIYAGSEADADGVIQLEKAALELGYPVKKISNLGNLSDQLPGAAAFAIGGTAGNTGLILDPLYDVTDDLSEWIQNGGRYLGICGGAYVASRGSQWDDGYEEGLALVDAPSYTFDPDYSDSQIVPITWQGSKRPVYYLNGPAFNRADLPNAEVIATYSDNRVAIFMQSSGSGKILLCGPHPEADESWLDDDPEPRNASSWTSTWELFIDLLETWIQ